MASTDVARAEVASAEVASAEVASAEVANTAQASVRSLHVPAPTEACDVPWPEEERRLRRRIVYSEAGGQPQALDLALPGGDGPHPVVLVFHGGGWSGGERTDVRDDIVTLASIGYAGAAIDYRLIGVGGPNLFPVQVADARCAVRYLRRHAADLGLDPTRVGALGYSAGAHLVEMLATASDVEGLDEGCEDTETSATIRAGVAYFGPADLTASSEYSPAAQSIITRLLGGPRQLRSEAATLASPLSHVDGGAAAMLLVHGTRDGVVPVEQSRRLRSALARAGVPVRLVEVEGASHGFRLFSRNPQHREGSCTALAFLRAALGD